MEPTSKQALERLVELTHAGALRAAAAFGQLAQAEVEARVPAVRERATRERSDSNVVGDRAEVGPSSAASSGVFFEFEGCLDALVGILFPAAGSERLVRGIVGMESGVLDPVVVESALMEVGNILASHVASGIADALRSRLLPSIPALAPERAEPEFDAWVERVVGPGAACIEAILALASGEVVGRLVLVPTRIESAIGPGASPLEPVC